MPKIYDYVAREVIPQSYKSKIRYSLTTNFYGLFLNLHFSHYSDLKHYQYYFKYFETCASSILLGKENFLDSYWLSDCGDKSFCQTLENPQYQKEVFAGTKEEIFLYDRFTSTPNQPSLLPPLHISPIYERFIGMHGAAVSLGEKSLLIFGENNSGKSTLTINLVFRGFNFLTDDTLIYNIECNQVCAFPRPIGIREKTLHNFHQLSALLKGKQIVKYKCQDYVHLMVSPEELFPGRIDNQATPRAAIFIQNMPGQERISIVKVNQRSLPKLLFPYVYYPNLKKIEWLQKFQYLLSKMTNSYVATFDIALINFDDFTELAYNLLK